MEGIERPATKIENLGWEAAYASNVAHTELTQAQARLDKLDEIASLGLKGVTVDGSAVEEAASRVEQSQRDFDMLSSMAGAVALAGDSPLAPSGMTIETPAKSPAVATSGRREKSASPEIEENIDKVLVCLLDAGGSIVREGGQTPTAKIRERTGLGNNQWTAARNKLSERDLIILKKKVPTSKRYEEIAVNDAVLLAELETGELSAEVIQAIERREKEQKNTSGRTPRSQSAPDFLDKRVGEEKLQKRVSEGLDSIHSFHRGDEERPARPHANIDGKNFDFAVEAEGRSLRRRIKVRELKRLPITVRTLLGIGQVNNPSYDFYKTEEQRLNFVLRIVNKGVHKEEQLTDEDGLNAIIDDALDKGYLHQNGNGLELTGAGVDFVRDTPFGKAKLGQKNTAPKTSSNGAESTPGGRSITLRAQTPEQKMSQARMIA